jgi:hypothetical protein
MGKIGSRCLVAHFSFLLYHDNNGSSATHTCSHSNKKTTPFSMLFQVSGKAVLFLLLLFSSFWLSAQTAQPDNLKLWFRHPASNWNEALPVGNGRLGARAFGGVYAERLQLNEETVWSGKW